MTHEVHSALSGTRTEENLHTALAGEAASFTKYKLYADAAKRNGDDLLAMTLEHLADNEKEHAELCLEYLGQYGTDTDNVKALLAAEEYDSRITYPDLADTADTEGFSEIASKFRRIAEAESYHARTLSDYLERHSENAHAQRNEETEWVCSVCGCTHTGLTPPERCPLCSRPGRNFTEANV